MKHHILVKWNDSLDKESLACQAEDLFSGLKSMKGIYDVKTFKNCIDRSNRYDLMIVIDMDEQALGSYDESEIHKKWKKEYGCLIQSKAIFDCE